MIGALFIFLAIIGFSPMTTNWSYYTSNIASNYPTIEVLPSLYQTGLSPVTATILQLVYLFCFFIMTTILISAVFILTQKKITLIVTGVLISFYAAVSFHLFPVQLSYLSVASYAALYHGFISMNSLWLPIFIMVVLSLIILLITNLIRKYNRYFSQYKDTIPYFIYFIIVTLGLLTNILEFVLPEATIGHFIFLKNYGTNTEGYFFLQHVYYVIVYLGFCYLFQVNIDNLIRRNLHYELIRYRSYRRWFNQLLTTITRYIFLFIGLLLALTTLIGLIKGYQFSFQLNIDDMLLTNWQVIYHFVINGSLQLLNYCLILIIISWIFKEAYFGLFGLTTMMLIMTLPIKFRYTLPIGLNAFGVLNHIDINYITFVLLIYLIIEYIIIQYSILV